MSLPLLIAIFGTFFLAILTISSSINEFRLKKKLLRLENDKKKFDESVLLQLVTSLENEKTKLEYLNTMITEGICLFDINAKLTFINNAAKKLLFLNETHALNTMDVFSTLPPHLDFTNKLATVMNKKTPITLSKIIIHKKLYLSCTITPLQTNSGEVIGAVLMIRDETLQQSVPRMKEDFTNILIHELRNPLTSINAASDLLISHPDFSPEEQQRMLSIINEQSHKLVDDVQRILDAAKLESGIFTIHKKRNHINNLLEEIYDSFQRNAATKMIQLKLNLQEDLPQLVFDEKYLRQALESIITNSLKFTSRGGTIKIQAKEYNDTLIITITDSGVGIAKDKQEKLFNKFSQIDNASANVGKGLGLYLVKGIIEAHDGNIVIESDRGHGTKVSLSLPLNTQNYHNSSYNHTPLNHHTALN